MGLSTTFNRLPSTIPKSEISKPLVDGLPILQKCCDGRPLRAKRSRLAAFVAQHQTGHFGTGLFDHICQPIARVNQKSPSQISRPGLQWVRKSQTTVHISPQLSWGAGRIRFPSPRTLTKMALVPKETRAIHLSYGAGDGKSKGLLRKPLFRCGPLALACCAGKCSRIFSASHPAGFDSRRPARV